MATCMSAHIMQNIDSIIVYYDFLLCNVDDNVLYMYTTVYTQLACTIIVMLLYT